MALLVKYTRTVIADFGVRTIATEIAESTEKRNRNFGSPYQDTCKDGINCRQEDS